MGVEQRYEISANFIRFSSKFKISIFTSPSSDRRAGTGAKNRNEARSEPKKRALLRKRQALRRHAKDASLQRRGPI